ncbi:Ku protein [Streptomyces sodiiphilus]
MRTIWKGAISFGLVSIPVKVVGATENHSVSFRQVHTADEGRIRYRKVCELEGEEVPSEEIGKAYEAADGSLVQLTDADFASLPLPTARTIEILGFLPVGSIDPYQLDRSYYLAPDTGAAKPYVLLREALRRGDRGAIAKLAMRGRETLALLRALEGDVLGMHTLLWPDEIRPAAGLEPDEKVTVRDAELDLADTLMNSLGEVNLEELHDEYRTALESLVRAKLAGREPEMPGERPAGGRVIDLMAALEDSVRTARESRGEGAGAETGAEGEEATVTSLERQNGKPAAGAGGRRKTAKKTETKTAPARRKRPAAKKEAGRKEERKEGGKPARKKTAAEKSGGRKRAS